MNPLAKEPARSLPKKSQDWCLEAEKAASIGDWTRAVVCYRRALELAPFCSGVRRDFEWSLEQQVESAAPAKSRRAARPAPVVPVPVEELIEELEAAESAPPVVPKKTRKVTRRRGSPSPLMRYRMAAIACLAAILITGVGLAVASGVGAMVGRALGPTLQASVLETPALEAPPSGLTSIMLEAESLLRAGDSAKAAARLRSAIKEHPDFAPRLGPALAGALRVQATAETRQGRHEAAARFLTEATASNPSDGALWVDLGSARLEFARTNAISRDTARRRTVLGDAEKAYREALRLDAENRAALLGLAQVQSTRNDRRGATETFERIVGMAPSSPEAQQARRALAELRKN
jgi:Tfp pilus assembly protein PilF